LITLRARIEEFFQAKDLNKNKMKRALLIESKTPYFKVGIVQQTNRL